MKKLWILVAMTMLLTTDACKRFTEEYKIDPHDLLSADKYEKLTVEVQSFEGQAPTEATLQNIKAFLEERLNKPEGINIVSTSINPGRKERYNLEDIRKLEDEYRTKYTSRSTAAMYFLFIDGEYAGNSGQNVILGVAYGASSMVIFNSSIGKYAGGIGQPSKSSLETAVGLHEVGHILGLVNNGSAMETNHEDASNARHCDNKNCLMYYEAETSDMLANFFGTVPSLDSNCLKDLRKNGGK